MARNLFPIDRTALVMQGAYEPVLTPPTTAIQIFIDANATLLADIQTPLGSTIADSTIYTTNGLLPEFLGPDGYVRLYGKAVGGTGPAVAIFAQAAAGTGNIRQLWATGPAAVALSGQRVVTPAVDGTLNYASNDNINHLAAPLWVTAGAVSSGVSVEALMHGMMVEPSWTWTPGPVYLGTNGLLTQVPPAAPGALFIAQVGTATSPTSLFVDRAPSIKIT